MFGFSLQVVHYYLYRREHKTCEFELHDVFAVDVIVSTGDGKVQFISLSSTNNNLLIRQDKLTQEQQFIREQKMYII